MLVPTSTARGHDLAYYCTDGIGFGCGAADPLASPLASTLLAPPASAVTAFSHQMNKHVSRSGSSGLHAGGGAAAGGGGACGAGGGSESDDGGTAFRQSTLEEVQMLWESGKLAPGVRRRLTNKVRWAGVCMCACALCVCEMCGKRASIGVFICMQGVFM